MDKSLQIRQPSAGSAGIAGAEPILALEDLHVAYQIQGAWIDVVRGVTFRIRRGETFGLVGESGCGKSTTAYAVMNYLGSAGRITRGEVLFKGQALQSKSQAQMRPLRGAHMGMVYQDPQKALNPALPVGKQIAEVVQVHEGRGANEARLLALDMLRKVHMPNPEDVIRRYPHQLSGGMQQRVLIAMALITNPDLLIMDEPTTGLDVTTEAAVLDLIHELKQTFDSAILYITHDLGVIAQVCDRVGVMYAGQLVESGTNDEVFHEPHHPYTLDLLGCAPRLDWHYRSRGGLQSIQGMVPIPTRLPQGCVYQPRCRFSRDRCRMKAPSLLNGRSAHRARCFFREDVQKVSPQNFKGPEKLSTPASPQPALPSRPPQESGLDPSRTEPLLAVKDLQKYYRKQYQLFGETQPSVRAVDGVSFQVREGETLSLVGESGCGKTTLGRCIVGLLSPQAGKILFQGTEAALPAAQRPVHLRRAMQIVFQNPDSTLNPRHKVAEILERPLHLFGFKDRHERRQKAIALLRAVRLDASYIHRYPGQLSGGEKQRVAIARAFASTPDLIVCDEAVSSLDVSVQASIINLLIDLKRDQDCGYLFISHDLSVVRYISDRIGVMYLGKLMEIGSVDQIFEPPSHPYTEALLSAVQVPDPDAHQEPIRLEGPVPSPQDPPEGCPFHTRCPRKMEARCGTAAPPWRTAGAGHNLFCHLPLSKLEEMQTQRPFQSPEVVSTFSQNTRVPEKLSSDGEVAR